jgi:hypothetical protein
VNTIKLTRNSELIGKKDRGRDFILSKSANFVRRDKSNLSPNFRKIDRQQNLNFDLKMNENELSTNLMNKNDISKSSTSFLLTKSLNKIPSMVNTDVPNDLRNV